MYIEVNTVNTKLWIKATAISKNVINTITKNGNTLNTAITPDAVNICHVNPANIANNRCPAVIFAANRTPKLIAFAPCDTNSIGISSGANTNGLPLGMKFAK